MTRRTLQKTIAENPPEFETINANVLPLMLTEKAAATFLGCSVPYLRRARSEGRTGNRTPSPPFVRVDGRIFYRTEDLRAWVASLNPRQVV